MDTLVALGTGAAIIFMLIEFFLSGFQNLRYVYFEASAMTIGLISLGHYIEAKAKAKTTLSPSINQPSAEQCYRHYRIRR